MKLNRVRDVAETLALHPISVYNLIATGELRGTRIGRSVRVSDIELDRFVQAHTVDTK
jgi:excisionase family DNA binding protein